MIRVAGLLVLAALAQDGKYSHSYKDQVPPEITAAEDHWINASQAATLEKLRGHVVWLEFSFLN
jgi:hypothetical protein